MAAEALFQIEREHRARGMARLAGVDEAGRGPLAGPVVAAAVVLPEEWFSTGLPDSLAGLNDSKLVNEADRKRWFGVLSSGQGIEFGVGIVAAEEVDRVTILQATHQAMRAARENCTCSLIAGLEETDPGDPKHRNRGQFDISVQHPHAELISAILEAFVDSRAAAEIY